MKKLSLMCAALLLSACGSSGGSDDSGGVIPPPPPAHPPLLDMFYTRVNALLGSSPDDAEPDDVSGITVTEPEDSEPVGT